jgi:hypothetical protein
MPTSVQNRIAKNKSAGQTSKYQKGGVPFAVANKLAKREATKQASKQSVTTPAKQVTVSKPTQTVSTGVSYQKTNTSQTPKQDTYAKIYKKPISTLQATKEKVIVKPKLENINLPEERISGTPSAKEKEISSKKVNVDELIKKGKVDKFIFTEDNATYLRTREGKEIRIDNGHYKKAKKKDYTSLHIRNVLGKVEERLGKSKQGMQASFFVQKEKLGTIRTSLNTEHRGKEKQSYMFSDKIRFGSMPKQGEKSILAASQNSSLIGEVSPGLFTAGVAKIPYMDDSLKIDEEPIRINSPYDYKNYVEKKSYEDPGNKFYQKTLDFLEEKMSSEVKKEDIQDAYQTNPNSRTKRQEEIVTEFQEKVNIVAKENQVNSNYGIIVNSREELFKLPTEEILARLIYQESKNPVNGMQNAVAWSIVNRLFSDDNFTLGKDVNLYNIMTSQNAYESIYQDDGNEFNAYHPDLEAEGWRNAVAVASELYCVIGENNRDDLVEENVRVEFSSSKDSYGNEIINNIGLRDSFVGSFWYEATKNEREYDDALTTIRVEGNPYYNVFFNY